MPTYKCGYCGTIGSRSTPPRTSCMPGRTSHSWRSMIESRICTWKCRKCGMITRDDQTPKSGEGKKCSKGDKSHVWDRCR